MCSWVTFGLPNRYPTECRDPKIAVKPVVVQVCCDIFLIQICLSEWIFNSRHIVFTMAGE